jgi:hypothetical protein
MVASDLLIVFSTHVHYTRRKWNKYCPSFGALVEGNDM